jgi:chaperone BCS1
MSNIDTNNVMASFGMMNGMSHAMHVTQSEMMKAFSFKDSPILNAFISILISSIVATTIMNSMSILKNIWNNIQPYYYYYYYKIRIYFIKEKEIINKIVNIKSITDNKNRNSLYNAIHWYLAHNNYVNYIKESPIDFSFEKEIDIDSAKKLNVEKIEFDKIVSNNKPITFDYKNFKINYTLSTKVIEVYGNEKKQKENYIITLETNIPKDIKIDILDDFCHLCLDEYIKNLTKSNWTQKIYIHKDGKWEGKESNNSRKLEKVILKNDMNIQIKEDIRTFINSETFYHEMDHPYTRGYLLFGNPGTGKTSTIRAISNECKRHIHYISLNEIRSDRELNDLLSSINYKDTILVIEDIDAMSSITNRRKEEKKEEKTFSDEKLEVIEKKLEAIIGNGRSNVEFTSENKLTLSGILNSLDGVFSHEGRILIMTTNHPEVLDEALIRPGRVDRKFKFTDCDHYMIKKLYNNFFGNEISVEVLENIKENFYSPAFVTCTFMQYRNDPKEAISHINEIEYLESKKPTIENNEI